MCAQPCRKKYSLVTADVEKYGRPTGLHEMPLQEQYLLSPKDLCTYREIPRLVNSPVASLKIEGRMKSPEYVAIVVSTYRRALDAAAAGTFVPDKAVERDLCSRSTGNSPGATSFGDRYEKLMGRDPPDNRGLRIGTVTRLRSFAKYRNNIPQPAGYPASRGRAPLFPPEPSGEQHGDMPSTANPMCKRRGSCLPSPVRCWKAHRSFLPCPRRSPPAPGRSLHRRLLTCAIRYRSTWSRRSLLTGT